MRLLLCAEGFQKALPVPDMSIRMDDGDSLRYRAWISSTFVWKQPITNAGLPTAAEGIGQVGLSS
jgi:hypothetical protein